MPGVVAASVWARLIDEFAKDNLAIQKANAAMGLLQLGQEAEF